MTNHLGDIDQLVRLLKRVDELEAHIRELQRSHLQFVCTVVYAVGGEMRLTPHDYRNVPPGTALHWMKDPMTGDLVFKTTPPEPEQSKVLHDS